MNAARHPQRPPAQIEERYRLEGEAIRRIRGIDSEMDHPHRWSRHTRPLCIDCGAVAPAPAERGGAS